MNKQITVLKEAEYKYFYNFIDENGTNVNEEFTVLGKNLKKGISSQLNPQEMHKLISGFGFWLHFPESHDLTKLQKQIDKCNNCNGCNYCCSKASQQACNLLIKHNELSEKLSTIQEFLKLEITVL